MLAISIGLAIVFLVLLAWQVAFSRSFVEFYHRTTPLKADADLPRVLVVLALRGADPFLDRCLRALFTLDYPQYDVHVVVDSHIDPAWDVVDGTIREMDIRNVQLKVLSERKASCGLRVSALIQEFRDLDPVYGAVAWLDADVIPHSTWLRELVTPLDEAGVGGTTGIRWYLPNPGGWGTVVRSLWNIGAIIQMHYFRIAFGGSMALRGEVVRETPLLETWSHLLWEDTYTHQALEDVGWSLRFVPEVTMPNQETIDLSSCARFMCRQVLNARLYHGAWWQLFWFGLLTSVLPYASLVLAVLMALSDAEWAAVILLTATVIHVTGMSLMYAWAGSYANRVVRQRKVPNWRFPPKVVLATPLTAFVYCSCLLKTLVAKRIQWRGIEYDIHGPWRIELVEYRPYQPASQQAENASL